MKKIQCLVVTLVAPFALTGYSEWTGFRLKHPTTKAGVVCPMYWGKLSDEEVQRVRACIEACEARGFQLKSSETVPPAVPFVKSAKPPSLPYECDPL